MGPCLDGIPGFVALPEAEVTDVRVSVVMPVHNAAPFIELAVRSALQSDVQQLEVIVVDDGSDDRSASIVAAIEDPRVVLLRQPASGGPSSPRNAGIAHARAPYIAFLDSDDLIKVDKLSAAIGALDEHPQAGFAFADFESIDELGALIQPSVLAAYDALPTLTATPSVRSWHLIPREQLAYALVHENFVGTSGVVVRRSVLSQTGGFDETLRYSEDRDLWFRLAHLCDALYWNRVGHSYRVRSGSLTYGPQIRNARARIQVLQREKSRWDRRERTIQRQLDSLIAENLAGIGYEQRRSSRWHAILMFARAFVTSPQIRWLRGLLGSVVN